MDALDDPQAASPGIVVCPFLVAVSGPWRYAGPTRDHRCSRHAREARLDLDVQRRYCLGSGGPGCPRYVMAPAPGRLESMLPVVVERGPLGATLEREGIRRLAAPASVAIVGAALGAFLLTRGPGAPELASGGGAAGATAGSSAPPGSMSSSPRVTAAPSDASAPTATPKPSSAPSAPRASASPPPVGVHAYTVRPGDNLGSIAAKFGTTTRVLVQLNGIANPSLIRVGQVLKLP